MIDRPSALHPNRQAHNWLAYDSGDALLVAHSGYIRGSVYDLGCGEAPYKSWLLKFADDYHGVDWSSTLHELCADIVADLNEPLPIPDGVADTVVSFSVMEHLREPRIFLHEAYRILRSGGAIIVQVPFMWRVHEAPYDYYRFTKFGLEYLFDMAGFVDVRVCPQTGFWTSWVLKFNYHTKRFVGGPGAKHFLFGLVLKPLWCAGQMFARRMDHARTNSSEAAGYFVIARKP